MMYPFNTDRSGHQWTDDDMSIIAGAIKRDIEALGHGKDALKGKSSGSRWWSYSFLDPSDDTVAEVAKQLRRPPGAIRSMMLSMFDEYCVDHGHLENANRIWEKMGYATRKEFIDRKLESIGELLAPAQRGQIALNAGEIPGPDQFDEKKFVDDQVWKARREAQEQALAILEIHSEQADETLKRRINTLKRQLGIRPTPEEIRAATRERVRQHRERKRA